MGFPGDDETRRASKAYLGLAVIWGEGIAMGLLELRHLNAMSSTLGVAVFALVPFIINLGLLGLGLVLWTSHFDDDEIARVAGWVIVGSIVIGLMATWTITHQFVRGRAFAHATFVTVNNMSVGAVIGFLLGWYEVSSRRHRRELEAEQSKLRYVNRLLRHHILNGIQIIVGHADYLDEHVADDRRSSVNTIRERSEEIVRFIHGVGSLVTASLAEAEQSFETVDLGTVLDTAVESARVEFEQAEFVVNRTGTLQVQADELVADLFSNLVWNAVEHNDKPTPQVEVTAVERGESVVVRVTDNGPGIPDDEKERMLNWNTRRANSAGSGIGLAIADTLAERYNGSLSIADNEPTGTVVTVVFPTVSEGS